MTAPLCLFWTIWHEMNKIVFKNEEISVHWMKLPFFVISVHRTNFRFIGCVGFNYLREEKLFLQLFFFDTYYLYV